MKITSKELLQKLYWENGLSTNEIAKQLNISGGHIHRLMKKYNIPRRSISQSITKGNKYEIYNDEVHIEITLKNGQKLKTLISIEDFDVVKNIPYSWCAWFNKCTKSYYAVCRTKRENNKRKTLKLHRLIMGYPRNLEVDHINHDTLDNRRENLRIVDRKGNSQNRKGANSNSKSGIRNVSWKKQLRKWQVNATINGKQQYFGVYRDIKVAQKIAEQVRIRHMPYSTLN